MAHQHLTDAWRTLVPGRDNPHGRLPPLLVLLTIVTGLVDAFSYLELGRVFVANVTGNVVFLAFAAGGAPGFVWWASLLAIAMFLAGAFIGGRVVARFGHHRARHLLAAAVIQACLVAAALVASLCFPQPYGAAAIAVLVVVLGTAMGLQNATARALAVPDLTTTVLTLTMTGLTADSVPAGGKGSRMGPRLVSILSMFLGALAGALLVGAGAGPWVLLIALLLLLAVVAAISGPARSDPGSAASRRPGPGPGAAAAAH